MGLPIVTMERQINLQVEMFGTGIYIKNKNDDNKVYFV